jgi:hypothetical protein
MTSSGTRSGCAHQEDTKNSRSSLGSASASRSAISTLAREDPQDGLGHLRRPCVRGDALQPDEDSVSTRSRCQRQVDFTVFKALYSEGVYRCPFPLLSFQCVLQPSIDNGQTKEEDEHFDLQCTLFLEVILCQVVILYKLLLFLDIYHI